EFRRVLFRSRGPSCAPPAGRVIADLAGLQQSLTLTVDLVPEVVHDLEHLYHRRRSVRGVNLESQKYVPSSSQQARLTVGGFRNYDQRSEAHTSELQSRE